MSVKAMYNSILVKLGMRPPPELEAKIINTVERVLYEKLVQTAYNKGISVDKLKELIAQGKEENSSTSLEEICTELAKRGTFNER